MKNSFHKAIVLASLFVMGAATYALPGLPQSDVSGEFIYYKDYSFTTESYVGFLYYGEDAYAARYYAPANLAEGALEKDITIYVGVNPDSPNMEFTGETIQGAWEAEDSDIINYLHDLMYEFTARRQKASLSFAEDLTSTEEFLQFGGQVKVTYSILCPIFNVRQVEKLDGTVILRTDITGMLLSTNDQSFYSYKGLPAQLSDTSHSFTLPRRRTSSAKTLNNTSFTLDSAWTSVDTGFENRNLWKLSSGSEDAAMIIIEQNDTLPAEYMQFYLSSIERQARQSMSGDFLPWNMATTVKSGAKTTINSLCYEPDTGYLIRKIMVINTSDGHLSAFTLNVFESIYRANKSYFDGIVNSVKLN